MDETFTVIHVVIPNKAGVAVDKIQDAVVEAAYNAQPLDRYWNIFIYSVGNVKEEEI